MPDVGVLGGDPTLQAAWAGLSGQRAEKSLPSVPNPLLPAIEAHTLLGRLGSGLEEEAWTQRAFFSHHLGLGTPRLTFPACGSQGREGSGPSEQDDMETVIISNAAR